MYKLWSLSFCEPPPPYFRIPAIALGPKYSYFVESFSRNHIAQGVVGLDLSFSLCVIFRGAGQVCRFPSSGYRRRFLTFGAKCSSSQIFDHRPSGRHIFRQRKTMLQNVYTAILQYGRNMPICLSKSAGFSAVNAPVFCENIKLMVA